MAGHGELPRFTRLRDLKSLGAKALCRFESGRPHHQRRIDAALSCNDANEIGELRVLVNKISGHGIPCLSSAFRERSSLPERCRIIAGEGRSRPLRCRSMLWWEYMVPVLPRGDDKLRFRLRASKARETECKRCPSKAILIDRSFRHGAFDSNLTAALLDQGRF